jgi:hypothetical protein
VQFFFLFLHSLKTLDGGGWVFWRVQKRGTTDFRLFFGKSGLEFTWLGLTPGLEFEFWRVIALDFDTIITVKHGVKEVIPL